MMTLRELLSHKLRDGKYRARKLGCEIDPALNLAAAIDAGFLRFNSCYYCGDTIGRRYEIDHKTPLEKGGAHTLANVAKTCWQCNKAKGTMTAEEFEMEVFD